MSKNVWLVEKRRGVRVTASEEDAADMVRFKTHEYEDDSDCPSELKNGKGRLDPPNAPTTEAPAAPSSFVNLETDSSK